MVSHEQSEGHTSLSYEDTRASATKFIASHMLPKSEGNNPRVRDLAALVSDSSLPTIAPSHFASPNRFALLSDDSYLESPNLPPTCPVNPTKPRPHPTQVLSSISALPLIADTGCTSLLLKFSNFPALIPFFAPKPLPLVPFSLPE